MAALVIRSLNVLLGIFFTFLGSLKITPAISRELHKVRCPDRRLADGLLSRT